MPCQESTVRIKNFSEVALGYTEEQAVKEAKRCLGCKNAPCVAGCPVGIDIPAFIECIAKKNFKAAIHKIKEKNSLPAICGRVCPQEDQCEKVCTLGKKYEPVAIGRLERFVADYELRQEKVELPRISSRTGKRAAVIGSGPAGLTVAAELARRGHSVTVFEALHKPGGVLIYGIPEFRLPKKIVAKEVNFIERLGVEVKTDHVVGKILTINELFDKGFDAVFIGIGAGLPKFMDIGGENLNGVYSANEFLTRVNLMNAHLFPEYDTPVKKSRRVAVVGGGNVAMDSCRVALRLGSEKVYNIYRRSRNEMPARKEEVENAEKEGIELRFLTLPERIIGNDKGWVTGIECIRMELGEEDESGRRSPVPVRGSSFVIDVEGVIMAIGAGANPLLPAVTEGLGTDERGYIVADGETGATSRKGVYAGGDIVTGSATVISAMGAARKSALAIDKYLMS